MHFFAENAWFLFPVMIYMETIVHNTRKKRNNQWNILMREKKMQSQQNT